MSEPSSPPSPSTTLRADQKGDGEVDLTLIRWMLTLTPAQRLQVLQQQINTLTRLKHARRR